MVAISQYCLFVVLPSRHSNSCFLTIPTINSLPLYLKHWLSTPQTLDTSCMQMLCGPGKTECEGCELCSKNDEVMRSKGARQRGLKGRWGKRSRVFGQEVKSLWSRQELFLSGYIVCKLVLIWGRAMTSSQVLDVDQNTQLWWLANMLPGYPINIKHHREQSSNLQEN